MKLGLMNFLPQLTFITTNPDSTPPVLDLNQITIKAKPTNLGSPKR